MSKRRGSAPAAATGFLWRQQQERAALAAALQQLPGWGAPPQRLLRGLERVLLCVEHTLKGPPLTGDAAGAIVKGDAEGEGPIAEVQGASADAPAQHALDLAAERAIGQLRELLAAENAEAEASEAVARDSGSFMDSGYRVASGASWDGAGFLAALLHHLLALSSDLLDGTGAERRAAADAASAGAASAGAAAVSGAAADGGATVAVLRDELAAAARLRLPVGVYARIMAGMGWEEQLLDLLGWITDPRVAEAAAERVLSACPGVAPGLAEALAAALPDGNAGADAKGIAGAGVHIVAAAAAASVPAPAAPGLGRKMAGAWWRPSRASMLAESAAVLAQLAGAVRQAAAPMEAEGGGGNSGAAASAAAAGSSPLGCGRWLSCLWLLARALTAALQKWGGDGADPVADTGGTGGSGGLADVACACCEALQEGLCAWQTEVVAPRPGEGEEGCGAPAFLTSLREQLLPLLDEQGRANISLQLQQKQKQGQGASGPPRPLLSHASAIQLRSRIALLGLAAASPSGGSAVPADNRTTGRAASKPAAACLPGMLAEDVWQGLPSPSASATANTPGSAAAALQHCAEPPLLPAWLRAATTAAARAARGPPRLCLPGLLPPPQKAPASAGRCAEGQLQDGGIATGLARVAAVVVALLTPGMASWLSIQADPRVVAAAGPNPYSPFRAALALIELVQGVLTPGLDMEARPASASVPAPAPGGPGSGEAEVLEQGRWLLLLALRLAAECVACVEPSEQQAALQSVLLTGRSFSRLQAHLAADAPLQAAAGRALVALSNRSAAVEASLARVALSAAAEAQRLAATARELLPFAVLTPAACVRRLLLDGLTHPGQQPWVLQLLRSFAAAAAAAATAGATEAPPAALRTGAGSGAPGPAPSVVLVCLQDVLCDAGRLLQSAADRRSLLGLVEGLLRCGVVAPGQLLAEVALPALEAARGSQGRRLAVAQVHAALLVAQLVLGGSEAPSSATAPDALPLPQRRHDPAAAMAAARPAALLLAVAAVLAQLYDEYERCRRLEAAAIDAAVSVLERGVQLYGTSLARVSGAPQRGAAGGLGKTELAELSELAAGCEGLPRCLVAALLPLLEVAASAPESAKGGSDENAPQDEPGDGRGGGLSRALVSRLAPAAQWRPRSLRGADPRVAHSAVYDTLAFAASSAAHAATVRSALLEAVADAADTAGEEGFAPAQGARPGDSGGTAWSAWACAAPDVALVEGPSPAAAGSGGTVARHVAATVARGLPQLPAARLAEALVTGLAELLPTASQEQARRLLLTVLPALVRAAGGGASVLAAPASAGHARAALVLEVVFAQELRCEGPMASPLASDVAVAAAVACRAATAALLRAAAAPGSTSAPSSEETGRGLTSAHSSGGAAEAGAAGGDVRDAAAVATTADRCAAHLSVLASQLAAVAASAVGQRRALQAQRSGGCEGGIERQVAAVALVLLAELCGVAAAAVEAAEAVCTGASARGLDVWQAIILSAMQQLVEALSSGMTGAAAAFPGGSTSEPEGSVAATAPDWVRATLRRVAEALRVLPDTAAHVLWGALERLCEEQGQGQVVQDVGGASPAQGATVREVLVAAVCEVGGACGL